MLVVRGGCAVCRCGGAGGCVRAAGHTGNWCRLGRPTYLSADLGFTSILSSIFFFFRQLPAELAERNSTKTGHMLKSKRDLKMHVRNLGYTLPLQIGDQQPLFRWLRNSTTTLTAYIFEAIHGIDNRASALRLQGSPTSFRNDMNFGPQTTSTWTCSFTHPT